MQRVILEAVQIAAIGILVFSPRGSVGIWVALALLTVSAGILEISDAIRRRK